MNRLISKDGLGLNARILDKNGMDLTKKIAVARINFDLTGGGLAKANVDLWIDGVDAAIPEMAWRTKHPASGEYEPLASMTFRDGTVVSFAKGTGTVSWNKGGGYQHVGEAGCEVAGAASNEIRIDPVVIDRLVREAAGRDASSNEARRLPDALQGLWSVLRVKKADYAWMAAGGCVTGDLAKAARFSRRAAVTECHQWVGYSIETVAEAQKRIDADPATVVIYQTDAGAWWTGDPAKPLTRNRSKAKRFPPVYGKLVTTDHPTRLCETIAESDARLEVVHRANEVVVIYDTSAKAWFSGGWSTLINARASHLLNAVRYTRKSADDLLRGMDAYRNGTYVIQTLDEASKLSPVYAVAGATVVGHFKGKIFVPGEEIASDPTPAAPIVSVAKAAEEPKDFLVYSSFREGWYEHTNMAAGEPCEDGFTGDPLRARRMTELGAKAFIATAKDHASHLIVERRDDAIARVEARSGKVVTAVEEPKDCIVRLRGQFLQENPPGITYRVWSNSRATAKRMTHVEALVIAQQYRDSVSIEPAPANTAPKQAAPANDDVYPTGGYVDMHGKPVTLEDLKASWGSPLFKGAGK